MKRFSMFILIIGLCLSSNGYADSLKSDVDKLLKKHAPDGDIVVAGKAYSPSLMREWKAVKKALREARVALNKARKALKGKVEESNKMPDYIVGLSGRLDALSESFNMLTHSTNLKYTELLNGLRELEGQLNNLKWGVLANLKVYSHNFNLMSAKLNNHMNNQDVMSFGVTAFGSADISTNDKDIMPLGGIGLTGSWKKRSLGIDLMVGAGVSVVGDPALSWTFVSSFQFYLNDKFSIGPASVLSQDLGSMEGADRLAWGGGCKFKVTAPTFNLWLVPSVGIHGERGHGQNGSPSYSPNIGVMAGVEYLIVK